MSLKTNEYQPKGLDYPIRQCSCGRCCNEDLIIRLEKEKRTMNSPGPATYALLIVLFIIIYSIFWV